MIFSLFIASLIQPKAWSVYLGSVVIGYGASGNFLCFYFNVAKISWRYNINCQHYWFIWGGLLYWGMIGTLFFTNFCTYRIWWFHVLGKQRRVWKLNIHSINYYILDFVRKQYYGFFNVLSHGFIGKCSISMILENTRFQSRPYDWLKDSITTGQFFKTVFLPSNMDRPR